MLVKKPVTFIKEICCFKFEEKYADDKIYRKFLMIKYIVNLEIVIIIPVSI